MRIKLYAHNSGPLSKAFLQTFRFDGYELVETSDRGVADAVLLLENDVLADPESFRRMYRGQQLFIVLKTSGESHISRNQPENVCVIDPLRLMMSHCEVERLTTGLGWLKAEKAKAPTPELPIPVFMDVPSFGKRYKVLVIDDTARNLRIAEAVLGKCHKVSIANSVQAAVSLMDNGGFDAVLTDMQIPPDKHYSALALGRYGVRETVDYGWAVMFEATRRGIPVAIVTDGSHHESLASAMFDSIKGATVNGQKVLFFNNIGKRWDFALKALMEG